jgi:uncharacterized membrane protein YidH (DUF202 family)
MKADPDGRDPTFAAERTDLAWSRSGLSLLACGLLILKGIGRSPLTIGNVAIGVCVLLLGALTAFLGAWHSRHARRRRGRPTATADLAPIALGVSCIGIAAFVVCAMHG